MTAYCEGPACHNVLPPHLPSNARYCSNKCKQAAAYERRASPRPRDASHTAKGDAAFRKLQGDAVLSHWKPHVTLETDIPDIPEFLRRKPPG